MAARILPNFFAMEAGVLTENIALAYHQALTSVFNIISNVANLQLFLCSYLNFISPWSFSRLHERCRYDEDLYQLLAQLSCRCKALYFEDFFFLQLILLKGHNPDHWFLLLVINMLCD